MVMAVSPRNFVFSAKTGVATGFSRHAVYYHIGTDSSDDHNQIVAMNRANSQYSLPGII
jgi:hypothetical protein